MIEKNSNGGKLYIGFTSNLQRRLKEHKVVIKELVYYEAYRNKKDAVDREQQLKKYKSAWGQLKKRTQQSRI